MCAFIVAPNKVVGLKNVLYILSFIINGEDVYKHWFVYISIDKLGIHVVHLLSLQTQFRFRCMETNRLSEDTYNNYWDFLNLNPNKDIAK